MIIKVQGLSGKSQLVSHLFLTNMQLFEYDPRGKKKPCADSALQRHRRPIRRVKKYLSIEDDQPKPKPRPERTTEVTEVGTLWSKDMAVTQCEKKFPGVIKERD